MSITGTTCFTWDDAPFAWSDSNFTWIDACITSEVISELESIGGSVPHAFRKVSKEKRKHIIELLVRIYSNDPSKSDHLARLTKEKIDFVDVTVTDIEVLAKEVLGIGLKITNLK